jgi:hypothetical protein
MELVVNESSMAYIYIWISSGRLQRPTLPLNALSLLGSPVL